MVRMNDSEVNWFAEKGLGVNHSKPTSYLE